MSERGGNLIYVWMEGEPGVSPADVALPDVPGERDLDLLASAVMVGTLGRILPVRLRYSDRPDPEPAQVRSIDTPRFLRDYSIRHRRRYEVMLDAIERQAEQAH